MKDLVVIAISAAIVNNVVLTYFLGVCPFLGVSRRREMAFGMGVAVTSVMTIAGTLTFLTHRYVLMPLNIAFLQYIVFIFLIAGMVQLVELFVRKVFPALYDAFGVFLPMITTNCAILGACLFVWLKGYDTLAQAVVFNVFSGIGFTLAIVVMAGIREELATADVPKPLRGAPITLFVAAILALAFMGFAGIGISQ
jgi:electron transport complex protein RnfA